jgi:ribose-phosphate pyrophosphokinase
MSKPVLFDLAGHGALAHGLATALGTEPGRIEQRRFPDGESYVRIDSPVAGRAVMLLAGLDRPDDKVLPLLFAAATARDLGAREVGLIAPYLAYMRQDARFRAGEGITSIYFARALSSAVDWLVTVDPHLHRRKSLSEIYSVPAVAMHAAPLLAEWIGGAVERPLLIGPDAESSQWVEAVARGAGAPSIVLEKQRRGDRAVDIAVPDIERWRDHTPVLVDDIVSTGRTMIETVRHLKRAGLRPPVCVAVHGVFAGDAYEALRAAGAARVITANTIHHDSNAIDVAPLIAEGVRTLTAGR